MSSANIHTSTIDIKHSEVSFLFLKSFRKVFFHEGIRLQLRGMSYMDNIPQLLNLMVNVPNFGPGSKKSKRILRIQ